MPILVSQLLPASGPALGFPQKGFLGSGRPSLSDRLPYVSSNALPILIIIIIIRINGGVLILSLQLLVKSQFSGIAETK